MALKTQMVMAPRTQLEGVEDDEDEHDEEERDEEEQYKFCKFQGCNCLWYRYRCLNITQFQIVLIGKLSGVTSPRYVQLAFVSSGYVSIETKRKFRYY
jgi:hypothetical protein